MQEFLILSLALRTVEGVGSAAFYTSSFTVATVLFPSNTGTIMVGEEGRKKGVREGGKEGGSERGREGSEVREALRKGQREKGELLVGLCFAGFDGTHFSCGISDRTTTWRAATPGTVISCYM